MLPVRLFSNRSQRTSNCGKNISDTLGYRTSVPPIDTKLSYFSEILKVYHAFAIKPMTLNFGKLTTV